MKNKRLLTLFAALFLLVTSQVATAKLNSIALYYGDHIPTAELHAFDVAVVEPDHDFDPRKFNRPRSQAFAYISIGEVESTRDFFKKIPKKWFISYNPVWKADVPDQSNPKWRQFYIDNVITPLWEKGYRGFLLDTMDSYHLVDKKKRKAQYQGLLTLLKAIKEKYPEAKLIFNRGFEFLPEIHQLVYAVAAESLYGRWNQSKVRYEHVSEKDRHYLLEQFKKVKQFGLPAISIDYVAPNKRSEARKIAKKISQHGIIPYVTDGHLTMLGVSTVEVVPRQIFVIYNGKESPEGLSQNPAFTNSAMPLEYMGYQPKYFDINTPLPNMTLNGRFAGIIVWMYNTDEEDKNKLSQWLRKKIKMGNRVAFIQGFGFPMTEQNLKPFNINVSLGAGTLSKLKITHKDKSIGYEIQPVASGFSTPLLTAEHAKVLLRVKNDADESSDMIAYTNWGGYALNPYVILDLPNNISKWIINPFKFFTHTLRLKTMPILDTTTLNGRRIMISHIDGDGFPSKSEWLPQRYSGEVIEQDIINHYKIPITVSIIEGELKNKSIPAKVTEELETIARQIFAQPWVEIASHSFSHPFHWQHLELIEKGETPTTQTTYDNLHLKIPGYTFSLKKEITGSVDYINKDLAPQGKRCKVFLWSGNTNPSANAVRMTYQDGLQNMNGGDTTIINDNISITRIGPLGINKGGYYQVYAPVANENLYTNLWTSNFYGFARVIETFKLTNKPRRFKPIDVYYHFYSGSKLAATNALKKVYDWSLKQSLNHLFVSEFTHIVLDFEQTVLTKKGDAWQITTNGHLRELRIPRSMGYPNLEKSDNVIGYGPGINGYYLHLGPENRSTIYFSKKKSNLPYIKNTNGQLLAFQRDGKNISFELKGHMPIVFTLANMKQCKLEPLPEGAKITRKGNHVTYVLKTKDSHALSTSCIESKTT